MAKKPVGQFYVEKLGLGDTKPVPIDNFFFMTKNNQRISLDAVGGSVVFKPSTKKSNEWFNSWSDALRRLADYLEKGE